MTELRNADVLAQRLAEAGCRHAFGMPGGEVLTLVDALAKAGIQFHLVKHENAAGFMAEGVWHRTGAPGIMLATLGPGAMNGVNAVANAHQDRAPLIVLTGAVDADEAETYTHQVLDHQAVFAPITKATFRLAQGAVATVADKALAIAEEGRAGPVHIDVPISLAAATAPNAPGPHRATASPVAPAVGTALDEARTWLAAAKRPLMVIGIDALRERAGTELRGFCERFGVPFITTYKAKGLIDERHPLCLGAAGLSPKADAILTPLIDSADLIL
ncbi:MAG: thiamine pyrophosphate-binding protein, partial [Rhodobacteraceae bacterium]|nr:thiamine pyrophosphate-binding protein [Paracoccaceae bacterium]